MVEDEDPQALLDGSCCGLAADIYTIYTVESSRPGNDSNEGNSKHRECCRFCFDKPEGRPEPDNEELCRRGIPSRPVPRAGLQAEDPQDGHIDLQLGEDGLHWWEV